jgi:hypothetical protein
MTISEKDVIDLTADLSDLETATSSTSSAKKRGKKRLRRDSHSKLKSNRDDKRRRRHGLVGEPFAKKGREKHYRAVHYGDLLIEVSQSKVSITRWLTLGRLDDHDVLRVSGWQDR